MRMIFIKLLNANFVLRYVINSDIDIVACKELMTIRNNELRSEKTGLRVF